MEKDYLYWEWRKILAGKKLSETEAARIMGVSQSGLNRKIREGTVRAVEMANILENFGYTLKVVPNNTKD